MKTLYEQLQAYGDQDYYGFHMPGHKRNEAFLKGFPSQIDLSEIAGFDDLHHARGVLKEAQQRAAEVWHAEESHFLINGSTVGILSAILGATKKGDAILVARNCHRSVYTAIELQELKPIYLYPDLDPDTDLTQGFTAGEVEEALQKAPQVKAVVLTSPTYEGAVSDVAGIADVVHKKGIPLIVDEAHGAHFGFHEAFPKNANQLGADLVIHSVHKTLPSLTQTALLHLNGTLVDREKVRGVLDRLQSSSPSYVLMASIDACADLLEKEGDSLFLVYTERLQNLRQQLQGLSHLKLVRPQGTYDPSKLVISVKEAALGSQELEQKLREQYHLQMEMTAATYVLGMTSVADEQAGFDRLTAALFALDAALKTESGQSLHLTLPQQERVFYSWQKEEVLEKEGDRRQEVPLEQSVGRVSLEYAYLYPPGSPMLVPGERINPNTVRQLCWYEQAGFPVEGLKTSGRIEVL